ncbi:Glycosyl transferases group 1 [compost metagenome]
MPLVIGEAMACGRPVVATAAPGVAELMGDIDTIVPIDDTDALAAAMHAALDQDSTSDTAATRRERIVTHFGIGSATDRWLALFEQLCPQAGTRPGPVRPCADA